MYSVIFSKIGLIMKYIYCCLLYSLSSFVFLSASEVSPNTRSALTDSSNGELSSSPWSCSLYSMYESVCKSTAQSVRFREKQTPEGQQIVLGISDPKLISDQTYQKRLKQEQERNEKSYALMAQLAQNPSNPLSAEEIDLLRSGTNRMQIAALWFQHTCQSQVGRENPLTKEQRAIQMLKGHAQPYLSTLTMFANSGLQGTQELRRMIDNLTIASAHKQQEKPREEENQEPKQQEPKQQEKPQEEKQEPKSQEPEDKAKNGQEDNKNEENKKELDEKNKDVREPLLLYSILETIELLKQQINQLDLAKSQQKYIPNN